MKKNEKKAEEPSKVEEPEPAETIEVKKDDVEEIEIDGDFIDGFDDAFGEHVDVPILDLKKKKEEAEQ